MFRILFVVIIFYTFCNCFNLDTDFPIVFIDPEKNNNKFNKSSYFGYSVVLYPGNAQNYQGEWVRIGAPRANDSSHPKDKEPGLVYNCKIMEGCSPITLKRESKTPIEYWSKNFIGGTMDISYEFDRMVICGSRRYYLWKRDYRMMGSCYWSSLNTSLFEKIDPLLDILKGSTNVRGQTVYYHGQGQAGFSAHFPRGRNELILGAPGVFNWAGTPFRVSDRIEKTPDTNRRRRETVIIPYNNVEVPDARVNFAYDFSGYSLSSGYFHGGKFLYATGSPRGSIYLGKVILFEFDEERSLIEREVLNGKDFGEYFGASLGSGKINGDNLDDLIVGAPFNKGHSYNEGKVYIFLGGKTKLEESTILEGSSINGQFGSAVMFLGDMDKDGYGDVAIGAPYENDGSGVVYLYKGYEFGLNSIPTQKIIGKSFEENIRGFGISISRAVDIDKNQFQDLAIGAHVSGNVVLLRSRPVVVVSYNVFSSPATLKQDSKSFLLNVCFQYSEFKNETLAIEYSFNVDKVLKRAKIDGENGTVTKEIIINQEGEACDNVTVFLKVPDNFVSPTAASPITASFSYELKENATLKGTTYISEKVIESNDLLCLKCPVLDTGRSNKTHYEIDPLPFTVDCGDDDDCRSKLSVVITYPDLRNGGAYVVGSKEYFKLKALVLNGGENAYSTKLEIVVPGILSFRDRPNCVKSNNSAITCRVANPLRENRSEILEFDLDVRNINKDLSSYELPITAKVITTSNNTNEDTFVSFLKVKKEADIEIYGKSDQKSNSIGNTTAMNAELVHIYKVQTIGASPLEKITVKIGIPHSFMGSTSKIPIVQLYKPVASLGNQPVSCQSDFTYLSEEKEMVEDMQVESTERRKRQVEIFKDISEKHEREDIKINDKDIKLSNKTFFFNCSMDTVNCSDITCIFAPFDKKLAVIEIKMLLYIPAIIESAGDNDMVLVSTQGNVAVDVPINFIQSGSRPDSIIISSIFINDKARSIGVALWIIIVAAVAGLLLLLLLIILLVKLGFFRRSQKHKLNDLKAAAQEEDNSLEMQEDENQVDVSGDQVEPFRFSVNSSLEGLCDEKE